MKVTIESGDSKFVFGPAEVGEIEPGDPQESQECGPPQRQFSLGDSGPDCCAVAPGPSFEPGEVVRLKSGGPAMTVSRKKENGEVVCCWMSDTTVWMDTFSVMALQPWMPGA